MPPPIIENAKKTCEPMLTAPIASALTRPTIIVSTSPIVIHATSVRATGAARRTRGAISERSVAAPPTASPRGVLLKDADMRRRRREYRVRFTRPRPDAPSWEQRRSTDAARRRRSGGARCALRGGSMKIGMTLPTMVAGLQRRHFVEWSRRVDAAPFSSLAAGERIAFPNQEIMVTMAAAAA